MVNKCVSYKVYCLYLSMVLKSLTSIEYRLENDKSCNEWRRGAPLRLSFSVKKRSPSLFTAFWAYFPALQFSKKSSKLLKKIAR